MVTTSGFPKSGTHALTKGLQLLGQPCSVNHIPFFAPTPDRHIFIKRDPRNVICSWLRFNRQPVTPGMFITTFRSFENKPFIDAIGDYVGWLNDPATLVVRYEDLIASDAELRKIAAWLGISYIAGAFEALPGLTMTWFPNHSDFNTIWTSDVESVWNAEGGPELLKTWGY